MPHRICWKQDSVDRILQTEALAGDDSVFLATHFPIEGFETGGSRAAEISSATEQGLFDALSRDTVRHAFCVVRGEPGSGKSHLIRWLNIQWKRCVLIGVQTWRNNQTQDDLRGRLSRIEKNTKTPPSVQVTNTVPPAQVIITQPSELKRAAIPSVSDTYPHNLSNADLQKAALFLASGIRNLVADYQTEETNSALDYQQRMIKVSPHPQQATAEQQALMNQIFQQEVRHGQQLSSRYVESYKDRFSAEVNLIRDEILARLPREERLSDATARATRQTAAAAGIGGTSTNEAVATDLERLAKMLPK